MCWANIGQATQRAIIGSESQFSLPPEGAMTSSQDDCMRGTALSKRLGFGGDGRPAISGSRETFATPGR